jgi:hypothetical protein
MSRIYTHGHHFPIYATFAISLFVCQFKAVASTADARGGSNCSIENLGLNDRSKRVAAWFEAKVASNSRKARSFSEFFDHTTEVFNKGAHSNNPETVEAQMDFAISWFKVLGCLSRRIKTMMPNEVSLRRDLALKAPGLDQTLAKIMAPGGNTFWIKSEFFRNCDATNGHISKRRKESTFSCDLGLLINNEIINRAYGHFIGNFADIPTPKTLSLSESLDLDLERFKDQVVTPSVKNYQRKTKTMVRNDRSGNTAN